MQNATDFNGVPFVSPVIDALREFDLIDRGMDPQSALDWCHNNGYANSGVWVPSAAVVGFPSRSPWASSTEYGVPEHQVRRVKV